MAKKTTGRTALSRGVSIDPQLYERAEARWKSLGMVWSEYVRRCIEADLREGGSMVIIPAGETNQKPKKPSRG